MSVIKNIILLTKIIFFFIINISILMTEAVHCPKPHVELIDLDRYAGTWYTYERSCDDCDEVGKCSKFTWSKPNQEGNSTVIISEISEITFGKSEVASIAYIKGEKLVNEIYVPAIGTIKLESWVLATDYDTYSIVYSCKVDKGKQVTQGIIYIRTRHTDLNMTVIAQNVYDFQKITMPAMIRIDQESCF